MKTLYLVLILILITCFTGFSQTWTDNLPKDKLNNGTLTLGDYQKAFDDYWASYNVGGGYYLNTDGEKVKAPGWKLFKRWVWKMENYVDGKGNFPTTTTPEELEKYFKENPESTKSTNGDWTNIGYNQSPGGYQGIGRINTIAFHPLDANTFWVGTPSGGMWKTIDGGSSWTVLTDNNAVLGVSAIAVTSDYATSSTIYIATGDRDGGSGWTMGGGTSNDNNSIGVLKSTDGGSTWNTTGLSFLQSQKYLIYDLLIDPGNNSRLIAATDNGLYETTDAGVNWTLFSGNVCTDLEFQPTNSNVVYAAFTNAKYVIKYNKSGSWSYSNVLLTGSSSQRTEIAVSANNVNVVYALTVNSGRGLEAIYKSTDAGVNYTAIFNGSTMGNNLLGYNCTPTTTTGQGTYDVFITANPTNANDVYVGGINVWRSTDGGSNWSIKSHWSGTCGSTVNTVHADQHCCEFHPTSDDVYIGNDGGIYKSIDNGSNWTDLSNGLTINQIYRLGVSQSSSNEVIIGLQDNGTHLYSGGNWTSDGVMGGDGMECFIDPTNINIQYGSYHDADIRRTSNHWDSKTDITAGLSGTTAWVAPFVIDPNVNTTLYIGCQDVFKSIDQGTNWTQISTWAGSDLKSIAVAPSSSSYIYAATNTTFYRTNNGGTSWQDVTTGLPGSGNITYITVKNDDPETVWVTIGGYNNDAVYVSTNAGIHATPTWTNMSAGLPSIPAMSIVQNVQNTSAVELYVSMTSGVWMKHGTSNWVSFNTGIPAVFCPELEIYYDNTTPSNSRLRAATFGRGLWESDLFAPSAAPVADFEVDNALPVTTSTEVEFTDLSSNVFTSRTWSFDPTNVTYQNGTTSSSEFPVVSFDQLGAYSVTLTVENAIGSDAETKTTYIHVGEAGKWESTSSTEWSTITNWENRMIPTSATDVTIGSPATTWPSISGNFTIGTDCNSLTLSGTSQFTVGGVLTILSQKQLSCAADASLKVGGNWLNNGTFSEGTGTVEFYGASASNITIPSSGIVYLIDDDISTWPDNWNGDIGSSNGQFDESATSYSGGNSPEIRFKYYYSSSATRRIYYDALNTSGLTSLTLKFRHYVNDYNGSDNYTLKVQYSTDGINWSDSDWSLSPTGNVNANQVTTTLTSASHGVGTETYYIAFTITGNLFNIDYWHIDDVQLYFAFEPDNSFYNMVINKSNAEVTLIGDISLDNDLTVKPTAYLTNAFGKTLTVGNDLTLEASASGASSFIDNGTTTVTGTTNVQYYCETDLWHYMSSCFDPGVNNFDDLFSSPVPTAFYRWDESHNESGSTGWWIDVLMHEWETGTFIAGQGYAISDFTVPKGTTYTLSGSLYNTTQQSPAMTKTTANTSSQGYNLVGNPFPCSMAANSNANGTNNFLTKNSLVLDATDNGIYFYDEAYGDYRTVCNATAPAYISRGQGFMVKTKTAGNKVSFNTADRKHGAATFYKGGDETPRFFLTINAPEGATNQTEIVFMEGMTNGLDISYDAGKIKGNSDLALYSYLVQNTNEEFAIQALPFLTEPVVVPIGFNAGVQGNYSFTAEMQNFDPNTPVTLLDKYTSKQVDLASNPQYSFVVGEPGTYNDRFLIHFKSAVGIEDDIIVANNYFEIYTIGNQVIISPSNNIEDFSVSVFNSIGQLMVQKEFTGNSNEQINIAPPGAYIVRVVSDKGVATKKVIVR